MSVIRELRTEAPRVGVVVILLVVLASGCAGRRRPEIDEHALMLRIKAFEEGLADKSDAGKHAALAGFADDMLHRRVRVESAAVMAVYERGEDWDTKPFFGFDYVEAHYLRLVDLDPGFHRQLHGERYWASVACISGDRQLMFELAMDQATHAALRPRQVVSFTCEVAGIIRGKTVYCRLLTLDTRSDAVGNSGATSVGLRGAVRRNLPTNASRYRLRYSHELGAAVQPSTPVNPRPAR